MDVYKLRWPNQLLLTAENEAFEAQGAENEAFDEGFGCQLFNSPDSATSPADCPPKSALCFKCFVLDGQQELVGPPQIVYIHARPMLGPY